MDLGADPLSELGIYSD
jgi:hypothetical protein